MYPWKASVADGIRRHEMSNIVLWVKMIIGSIGGWDACFIDQNAPHQEDATIQYRLVVKHSKDAFGDVYSPKISVRCKQ